MMVEPGPGPTGSSFDERLRATRAKMGLDAATPEPGASQSGAYGVGLRVGIELVTAPLVGTGIGWALDHWLGTMPLFLIVFILLGGVAGIMNAWRQMSPGRK